MANLTPARDIIAAIRDAHGWTQEQLADRSKVSVRTIQRAEKGQPTRSERLSLLADALGVSVAALCGAPANVLDSLALARENMCRYCGAKLTHRAYVDHEFGDAEVDQFECGAMTGWQDRPCPQDPRFPAFDDYELHTLREGDRYYSYALGRTEMARAVFLPNGSGATKEAAERWVQRGYVRARSGDEAAEAFWQSSSLD